MSSALTGQFLHSLRTSHLTTIQLISAVIFGLALLHTFAAKSFEVLAHRHPRHAGVFHLLGEVKSCSASGRLS